MPSLSVVLPAYNEAENIEEMTKAVMKTITPLTEEYEIIVVDDGSADGTADEVAVFSLSVGVAENGWF